MYTTSILVVGNEGAGKTSLILRMMNKSFSTRYSPTEFIYSIPFKTRIGNKDVRINFYDTDGIRQYENYSINYYEGKSAIIVIYDITKQESLQMLQGIIRRIKQQMNRINRQKDKRVEEGSSDFIEPIVVLVGNKTDMNRELNQADAKDFAEQNGMEYIETSAKTGDNVKNLFDMITANHASYTVQNFNDEDDYWDQGTPPTAEQVQKSRCCSIS